MDNQLGYTQSKLNEIRCYAAFPVSICIGGIAFTALSIFLVIEAFLAVTFRIAEMYLTFSCASLILGAAALIIYIRFDRFCKDSLENIQNKGRIPELITDFEKGERFNNGLILGDEFIIGRQNGTVIFYRDIERLYEKDMTYHFVLTTGKILYADLRNRKKVPICMFSMLGSFDVDSEMRSKVKGIIIDKAGIRQ